MTIMEARRLLKQLFKYSGLQPENIIAVKLVETKLILEGWTNPPPVSHWVMISRDDCWKILAATRRFIFDFSANASALYQRRQ